MLELYKDFYCFYILKNLQQTNNGSTEMLEVGVVGGSRPTAMSATNCTGNTGAISLEKVLVKKTVTSLKNQIVIIISQWQPIAAPPHNDRFTDFLT